MTKKPSDSPFRRERLEIAFRTILRASAVAFAVLAAESAQPASSPVSVYPLDCGRIDISDMDPFADDGSYKGVAARLVDSCYLVRHPKGDLLWDAGVGDQYQGTAGVTYMPGFVAHVPVSIEAQLKALGSSLSGIQYLAFSHEHVDHTGNANALTNAIWILNRSEHQWAIEHDGKDGKAPANLSSAMDRKVNWIAGDYDVFGDGTVRIIATPGHTPGHQVLLVTRDGKMPVILAGDLWHSYANYEHDRVPRFNSNRDETVQSMSKTRTLAKQTRARILIGHAPEDFPSPSEIGKALP